METIQVKEAEKGIGKLQDRSAEFTQFEKQRTE